jgi:uncharacterized protein (UPF0254 family)
MSQHAQATRYGNRAAHGAIARADVGITVTAGMARVSLCVDSDTKTGAVLSLRTLDVQLLADALQDAAKAMKRTGPPRPAPMRTSAR